MTTHSPHIVSVSPLDSIVLLRKTADRSSTEGVSTAALDMENADRRDLERYLDVTRGEMLFAKGILLVEGDAELFLIPMLGKLLGFDFDELGITVCSVAGTNFTPYVRLLGPKGLKIPFAVLTDFDPDDEGGNLGEGRVIKLMAEVADVAELEGKSEPETLALAKEMGIFLNEHTLEVDLFKSRPKGTTNVLIGLSENNAAKKRAKAWQENPQTFDSAQYLKDIRAIGKGRFAQRLATRLNGTQCPPYIIEAISYVAERCS